MIQHTIDSLIYVADFESARTQEQLDAVNSVTVLRNNVITIFGADFVESLKLRPIIWYHEYSTDPRISLETDFFTVAGQEQQFHLKFRSVEPDEVEVWVVWKNHSGIETIFLDTNPQEFNQQALRDFVLRVAAHVSLVLDTRSV